MPVFGNSLMTMSPGGGMSVPGNIGGGGKKPSNWLALAAAPIAALLGSHLGGMDYSEALGAFGAGFANEKYSQLKQRRNQEFEEEGRTIDLAHKAVQDLKDVDSQTIQKFPKLQSLAQKYQAALADDGKISTAEAKEIVILSQHLQSDLSQAKQLQGQERHASDLAANAEAQDTIKSQQLGRAFPGTEGGSPEEMADVGRNLLDSQRMADLPQLTSVKLGDEERQLMLTELQRFQLAKEEERAQVADRADRRRQESQERIARYQAGVADRAENAANSREAAANSRQDFAEWKDGRDQALADLEAKAKADFTEVDPMERKRVIDAWDAVRPRRSGAPRIAPLPSVSTPLPKSSGRFKILEVK